MRCGAGDDPSISLLAYLVRVRRLLQQDVERGLAHGCGTVGGCLKGVVVVEGRDRLLW